MSTVREGWNRYALAWADRYGGYDPRRAPGPVRRWQRIAYRVARLLVRWRVRPRSPAAVAAVLTLAVPVAVYLGGRWLAAAAGLVVASTFAATVASAVALLRGPVTGLAAVYEAVATRLSEVVWLVALWLVGVAGPVVVACGAMTGLLEYTRTHAMGVGMRPIGAQTAGDRPARVTLLVIALGLGGLVGDGLAAGVATVAAAGWLLLVTLGYFQLLGAVRRSLA